MIMNYAALDTNCSAERSTLRLPYSWSSGETTSLTSLEDVDCLGSLRVCIVP